MAKVAVLGCGPAGLLAAHAVEQKGHEPVIFSRKIKSQMPGAIFMHEPVPGLTSADPEMLVHFSKIGDREGYARKVYKDPLAPCSWDEFPEDSDRPAWDLKHVYSYLYYTYESRIRDVVTGHSAVRALAMEYPLVLSTIPATALCRGGAIHNFQYARVWIREQFDGSPASEVVYNGDPTVAWYRSSRLFGYHSQEYGHIVPRAFEGKKPTFTNCDCCKGVVRLGRFGKWEKGVLVTDAYKEALDALDSMPFSMPLPRKQR